MYRWAVRDVASAADVVCGMPRISLTRQELYDRVWTTPIDRLSRELRLSGRGLGKLCERHGIPVPPRGYWAKKGAGKQVKQPPLPAPSSYTATTLWFVVPDSRDAPDTSGDDPGIHPLIAFEQQADHHVAVPDDLAIVDERLQKTQQLLAKAKRDATGRIIPPATAIPIRTSRAAHERALRLMQALLTAFTLRGFEITRSQDGYHVRILAEDLGFVLEEELTSVDHAITFTEQKLIDRGLAWQVPKKDQVPSGRLVLVITNVRGVRQRWTESSKRLEDRLNSFLIGLVRAALGLKEQRAEAERRRLQQHEEERQRQEDARRQAELEQRWREERGRVERLEHLSDLRERHHRLSALVQDLERVLEPVGSSSEVGQWLRWARAHVSDSDPVARMARLVGRTVTVYYHGYDVDHIRTNGFSEPTRAPYTDKDVKAGVELTTNPGARGYYAGRTLPIELPEALLLPYEWLQQTSWTWRTFRVPAKLLNRVLKYGPTTAGPATDPGEGEQHEG